MSSHTAIQKVADEYGLRITEPKRHLDVQLNNRDIRNSSMQSPTSCAFAKACRRQDGVVAAYFFLTVAYLQFEDRIERYALPPSVRSEIVAFDRGGPAAMEAGVYRLSPVGKTHRLGNKQSASMSQSGNGRRRKVHRLTNVRKATF